MRRLGQYLGSSLVICCCVGFGLFQASEAGKTIKLPHYDVKFGKWPLMEITKRAPRFRLKPGGRGNRGRHIGGPPPPPLNTGYRLGPPLPPGKLVLLSPNENKGKIHQHLQQTLKHYASTKDPVNNFNLPIIVKAPGPKPPPPPPGYKLGTPGGPPPDGGSWKPGPPPFLSATAAETSVKSSRLKSMLQNAAQSGMFKDHVDTYVAPGFSPGPQESATFVTFNPDGTQITTHTNGNFVPPAPTGPAAEEKPSVPPVIKIGGNIPENYTVVFAQRQIVGVKSPDTLQLSGNEDPEADEYDLGVNLGTKYEQGYGRKPPPTHPLVITKFQKRGDVEPIVVKKLVQQSLPDAGLISTTNIVFSSPNISAPLGGKNSPLFQEALADKQRARKQRKREKPLDAQVKLLGRLFTKLQRLKPPKIPVPEDELSDDKYAGTADSGTGWGWTEDDDGGWKKSAKTKVDSPIMAVQIQTYSAPEVNSGDPDVLESMAEFGNHDVEFGETDEIVNLMETVMKHGSSRINLADLGSNPDEINDNMMNWVRRHLAIVRNVNQQAHSHGEKIAYNQFKQYQTFVTPPFGSNGWGPGQPEPVDPKKASRSMPATFSNMAASMQAPNF